MTDPRRSKNPRPPRPESLEAIGLRPATICLIASTFCQKVREEIWFLIAVEAASASFWAWARNFGQEPFRFLNLEGSNSLTIASLALVEINFPQSERVAMHLETFSQKAGLSLTSSMSSARSAAGIWASLSAGSVQGAAPRFSALP